MGVGQRRDGSETSCHGGVEGDELPFDLIEAVELHGGSDVAVLVERLLDLGQAGCLVIEMLGGRARQPVEFEAHHHRVAGRGAGHFAQRVHLHGAHCAGRGGQVVGTQGEVGDPAVEVEQAL